MQMKKTIIRKMLLACTVTAAFGASSSAMAAPDFPDFVINESAISGTLPNSSPFSADKITGNYEEAITFSGGPSGGTFNVALKWNAGQFVTNDGTDPVASQLGASTASQYGLYALYEGHGTFTMNGAATIFNFDAGGSLRLFADPNADTTFGRPATGASAFSTGLSADDILLATGEPVSGLGNLDPTLPTCSQGGGINCGSFGASSTFLLTAAGSQYFVRPIPFYNVTFESGQLNNFSPAGTQFINGSLDVIMAGGGGANQVPEPATLAMIGAGLLGLGLTRRRKQA
jgi:hypothetical protein